MSRSVKAVVLVEGESDRIAVETLAARRGRDLAAEGVAVVAVGGAHALERALRTLEAERVAGLYDRGEEAAVRRGLDRAGVTPQGFYACDPDLEGELVRALGPERTLQLVEERGQLAAFRTYQRQPEKRSLSLEARLHGWLHNWKVPYAAALRRRATTSTGCRRRLTACSPPCEKLCQEDRRGLLTRRFRHASPRAQRSQVMRSSTLRYSPFDHEE